MAESLADKLGLPKIHFMGKSLFIYKTYNLTKLEQIYETHCYTYKTRQVQLCKSLIVHKIKFGAGHRLATWQKK